MRNNRRLTWVLFALALLVLGASSSMAGTPGHRAFVPVQAGYQPTAPDVPEYAPGRIIVQFTAQALRGSTLNIQLQRGATAPGVVTGIASIDALVRPLGVKKISRSYGKMKNQQLAETLGVYRWYRIDVDPGADIPSAAARLEADPNVAHASPDWRAFPATVPADPLYSNHWGHNNTSQLPAFDWGGTFAHTGPGVGTPGFDASAELAWSGSQGYGSASVVIAILDSGVDTAHPDLNLVAGWDFGSGDSNPMDDSAQPGHGTATAGVAAAIANNGIGIAGAAGGCSIMPLKVADNAGSIFFSAIDNAIYHAANNGADIISMSLGAATSTIPSTETALQYADGQGVVTLAATGNENAGVISYPAISQWVIGVGAASPCGDRKRSSSNGSEVNPGVNTDPNGYTCDGERWWGSNYGVNSQDAAGAVDVIAPTILPTTDITGSAGFDPGDYDMFFNGTSCATPYAAGVCALIKSLNPTWTPAQVRAQLVGTADDVVNVESGTGWDRYSGYGMVNAAGAVGLVTGAPPVADFAGSPTSGCANLLNVTFNDLSTGSVTSWDWDFGDGATSTLKDPNHVYTTAGLYSVSLTVAGPGGADSLTKADLITVFGPPTMAFTASDTSGVVPFSVTFTEQTSGTPAATSWDWDFGDGSTSTAQNPQHWYVVAGTYTVTLIATNSCGADTLSKVNYITVDPLPSAPVAAFTGSPLSGCAPLAVTFTDQSTGSITSWAWDFGDSTTSTLQNPSHTYTAPGTYNVSLTVTGPGGFDTATQVGYVTVTGPPATAFSASPLSGVAPLAVTFSDSSSGAPTSWSWDFGDGNSSTMQNPSHTYTAAGTYDVTLITTNLCGPDTLVRTAYISVSTPPAPVAGFTASPTTGCSPLAVNFTDQSSGTITSWAWDFGDSATSTLQNPSHTYTAPGTYNVSLTVTGPGGFDTLTKNAYISVLIPPTAAFAASDTTGQPPLAVTFSDSSTGGPTSWAWDFGDAATDTVPNPTHTYAIDGTYTVTLVVSNACGADTASLAITVQTTTDVAGGGPVGFGLRQNYPNPFNPTTNIEYSLDRPGRANLSVFDVSGRHVATLLNREVAAGIHHVVWRAPSNMPSGVYFARLKMGSRTDIRRLVLVR